MTHTTTEWPDGVDMDIAGTMPTQHAEGLNYQSWSIWVLLSGGGHVAGIRSHQQWDRQTDGFCVERQSICLDNIISEKSNQKSRRFKNLKYLSSCLQGGLERSITVTMAGMWDRWWWRSFDYSQHLLAHWSKALGPQPFYLVIRWPLLTTAL